MACVDLPAFPLQILLGRHPDWRTAPAAVVDRDTPRGVIRWVNEPARARGVRPGMRYGAGAVLAPALRAGEVAPADVDRTVAAVAEQLRRFTPGVEPCRDQPGVFWLDASGLSHLHASLREWADAIEAALRTAGFQAAVACGFTRFGTYAIARAAAAGGTAAVIRDRAAERILAGQTPLERLDVDPALKDSLDKLGVRTVRALLALPPAGVRRRFGPAAHDLHQRAAGALQTPVQPLRMVDPLVARLDLDHPETDASRLLFAVKRLLDRLLATAAARHETLAGLTLHLWLDGGATCTERIRPAAPTLDVGQLLNLVRLRLEVLALRAGVTGVRLSARAVRPALRQPVLFAERPRRDPALANRALARVRAQFGDGAVVRARLADAHLPEAQFAWEPVMTVERAAPRAVDCRPLVRRIHTRPLPAFGGPLEPLSTFGGPHVVSGGWWAEAAHREYYFAAQRGGGTLWIYYDRPRRRWRCQGQVE